ncbi:MFS transporter [Paremcibacter congregatus]|nr:MFS transporter [Paremcibacter congregatus]
MGQDNNEINRDRLFVISLLALFTAGMSAALRAAVAGDIKTSYLDGMDLAHSGALIAEALGVSFLGFAITLFLGSPLLDIIGMKRMLLIAAFCFIVGTGLVVFSGLLGTGASIYSFIWGGMLLSGVGWGCVEATINPLTTALYQEEKTHRLNVLHAWWPAGIVVGGLSGVFASELGLSWQMVLSLVVIPAGIFAYMCMGMTFPQTERAEKGVSFGQMMLEVVRRPSFLVWFGAMFLTAASELAPGQWVDVALTKLVGMRGVLLLVYVSGLMFVMRHFAGVLVHRLSNPGLLMFSSLLGACGLYLLSVANSPVTALVAATVWGIGVCYMWPTMLASVSERYPRGGSWMIGLIGSAGALSIYFVLPRLGAVYDQAKLEAAGGAEALAQLSGQPLDDVLAQAASESFQLVAVLPVVLIAVFGLLWVFERRSRIMKKQEV